MNVDHNGLDVLDRQECLALLGSMSVGRVGISLQALPVVLPVAFRLISEQIVFSTAPGSKLRAATNHAVIAFEVDHIDPLAHTGWSVLATGMARRVTNPAERDQLTIAGVPHWLAGDDAQLVVVGTDVISGRRLTHDVALRITAAPPATTP
jgi:nitroimidazol reductase NimA-like FMN-containing flavoprotein (pyridoxamine 5'-phosphate oxidase superfamily)